MQRAWQPSLARAMGGLVLLAAAGAAIAADAEEIRGWLDRMAMAVNNLNYRGTLVYLRGGQVDALRIFHRVDEHGMRERLVALNGAHREVLRDNQSVRCIFADSQSIVVDTRIAERLFPVIPPDSAALLGGRYQASLDGSERIAEREAQIVSILPRDGFRYGYRLWLERDTAMLLKSNLLDDRGEPLEQLMFTEIEIGGSISERDLAPDLPGDRYVQVEIPRSSDPAGAAPEMIHWQVLDVPEGFTLSSHGHGDRHTLEHMVFSDGLASVSVYVEPARADEPVLSGYSRVGAMSMFGRRVSGFTITAVGEVPASTVQMMARSVQQRTAAGAAK